MQRIELLQVPLCTGCGKCCHHIGLPPFEVANPDLGVQPVRSTPGGAIAEEQLYDMDLFYRMPAALRAEHASLVRELKSDPSETPCVWLDAETNGCRHYEWRPAVCRDFQPGTTACQKIRLGAKCVWYGDGPGSVPVEVWRNPRHQLRYPDLDAGKCPTPALTRWQKMRAGFANRVGYVIQSGFNPSVVVKFVPFVDIRIGKRGIRVRRKHRASNLLRPRVAD